jgi:hypothetical protein
MTHQLQITDVGSAGSNFTLTNGGTSTGLISYDQSISQITLLPKPAGSSPDTVSFLDPNPGHVVELMTTTGNPQINITNTTGSDAPLLTITGAGLGPAPVIEAIAGQSVIVNLTDPGKRTGRTFAAVGPTSGQANLQVAFPTANVVFERLLRFPALSSGTVWVRFRDGATYTVNYTNMNASINGSEPSSGPKTTRQHRRRATSHGRFSADRNTSESPPPHAHPASVLARPDGSQRGPLRIMPPAWRRRDQKK